MTPPELPRVAGVVLAAGTSTRLGRNKLLLPLGDETGGETVVRRAVRSSLAAPLDPVIVVLGYEAERVREQLSGLACLPVVNDGYARGVGSSVQAGVARAKDEQDVGALVLVLADMPLVTAAMLAGLVERYRATGARLVVSRYGEVGAPPNLFDRSLFTELLAAPEERCARRVVLQHEDEAEVVSWPQDSLRDIDVAADYDSVRTALVAASASLPTDR